MIDLSPVHYETVKNILLKIVPEADVFIFGSRTTSCAKVHSDLDLAIKANEAIAKNIMRNLRIAFEDSDLPFRVDVVDLTTVNEPFKEIIKNQAVRFLREE